MRHPIIKLQFDKKLEQDISWQFYNHSEIGGVDFWKQRVIKYYPKLLNIDKEKNKKQYLEEYILTYYDEHKKEIEILSSRIDKNLKQNQEYFFDQVDKIFNNYPWPQKEIIGNFSIFNFCPRFLEENKFQVFLYGDKNHQLFTIFHECLHFIFYDFAKKNFPNKLGKMNTEEGLFWELAEVFNAVIQNTDEFILLHGKIKDVEYPEHRELIKNGVKIWNKNKDVYVWIEEMLNLNKE